MCPAVPLRAPEHLLAAFRHVMAEASILEDECVARLLDNDARGAAFGVDSDQPRKLMAALGIFEGEAFSVGPPGEVA